MRIKRKHLVMGLCFFASQEKKARVSLANFSQIENKNLKEE